ncbi:MAG: transporter substrate-binding domain-containing protein [Synechococcales bacterium]|nr:transporter substrate-binding domain-containing protein [Synechococcales bacterium]
MGFRRCFNLGALLAIALPLAACTSVARPNRLVMATSPDYCPYEFMAASEVGAVLTGFDIELAEAIATELGHSLKIETQHFNGLLPALQDNRIDFVMAAMTPTAERKAVARFSRIYHEVVPAIVAPADSNLTTLADLVGKEVGVRQGSFFERIIQSQTGVVAVPVETTTALMRLVRTRQVDAGLIDASLISDHVTPSSRLEVAALPNSPPAGVAIAFPPNSTQVGQFNTALRQLEERGEIERLARKWFEDYTCPAASDPA